jgi:flagellar basal body-associated protein FliL
MRTKFVFLAVLLTFLAVSALCLGMFFLAKHDAEAQLNKVPFPPNMHLSVRLESFHFSFRHGVSFLFVAVEGDKDIDLAGGWSLWPFRECFWMGPH